jgi:hypothetical protein
MTICREQAPPLYQTTPHRVTACHLYREEPVAASKKLSEIFIPRAEIPQRVPAPATNGRETREHNGNGTSAGG